MRLFGAVVVAGALLLGGNAEAAFFQSSEPVAREVQTVQRDRAKKPPSRFTRFVMRLLEELVIPRP
jgi:hypothetical protein